MPVSDVDVYAGKRLRRRRRLLGLSQQDLANQVGIRFQQIQKYECGANRMTASRLFDIATVLNVSVNYFFDGLAADGRQVPANDTGEDILARKETRELVRAFEKLSPRNRQRVLDLAASFESDMAKSTAS